MVLAILLALVGLIFKKPWSKFNKITSLIAMIVMDVQFLLGVILYFGYSAYGLKAFSNDNINVMKDKLVREIAVEHLVLMLAAWILVHIGYSKMKKATNKHLGIVLFYTLSLALILIGIPWDRVG